MRIVSIGAAAPETRVSNAQLESFVDTSDEWIQKRTGIGSRHLLDPSVGLSNLASLAAQRALQAADVDPSEVDLVILATSSPDDLFGDAACVASEIGATKAVAFDLTAACSGFMFGVNTASQFLHNGAYNTAVVIGADALSRWVDWSDRKYARALRSLHPDLSGYTHALRLCPIISSCCHVLSQYVRPVRRRCGCSSAQAS